MDLPKPKTRRSHRIIGTPVRNVDISDDVMEGTLRESFNRGSPPPTPRQSTSRSSYLNQSDANSRSRPSFSLSTDRHGEHGIEPHVNHNHEQRHHEKVVKIPSTASSVFDNRLRFFHGHDSNQNRNQAHKQPGVSGGHHNHPHSSAASAVRMVQQSETNFLPDGSVRNKVWTKTKRASTDGNWVVSEEEEYIANTSGGPPPGTNAIITMPDFHKISKACKIMLCLMIVILVIGMFWNYGFHFFQCFKLAIYGGLSVVTSSTGPVMSLPLYDAAALPESNSEAAVVVLHSIQDAISSLETELARLRQTLDDKVINLKTELRQLEAKVMVMETETIEREVEGNPSAIQIDKVEIEKIMLPLLITEVEKQISLWVPKKHEDNYGGVGVSFPGLSMKDVHSTIKLAIEKYDADKIGLPDLALESGGGSILGVRDTPSLQGRSKVVKSFWGFPIWSWSPPNTPRTIIRRGVVPGECWSFEGSVGSVVIKLALPAIITGFTLEHIPKTISPYGSIDSAPKEFQVFGLMNEYEPDENQIHDFGTFTFEDTNESLQYFSVLNTPAKSYPIVELKVLSNRGNVKHTCIYRFRVHGLVDFDGEDSITPTTTNNNDSE